MNTRTISALAAAGFLAAACATDSGHGPTSANLPGQKCATNHPVCHITVRVKDCKVTVEPDVKYVARRAGGATMLWTVRDSPGVVFASSGIVWKREVDTEARSVFRTDHKSLASATVSMHNNTALGKYPYTVNVVDNGKLCAPHDPSVVNEM